MPNQSLDRTANKAVSKGNAFRAAGQLGRYTTLTIQTLFVFLSSSTFSLSSFFSHTHSKKPHLSTGKVALGF